MQLDNSHLELLAALAEHRTISAASDAINLSQSAASRRLQEAERRLGIKLVVSEGRTVRLTASGRLLAETAIRVNRDVSEAEFAARWLDSGSAAPTIVGVGFFDRIGWMLPSPDTHPYELVRSNGPLARDASDAHVSIDVVGNGQPSEHPLGADRLVAIAGVDHPLASMSVAAARELSQHRYLASRPDPRPGFELETVFLPSGHGPETIMRVESFSALLDLVASGVGVSIQPRLAVSMLTRADIVVVELDRNVEVTWELNQQRGSENSEAFAAAVREQWNRAATLDATAV